LPDSNFLIEFIGKMLTHSSTVDAYKLYREIIKRVQINKHNLSLMKDTNVLYANEQEEIDKSDQSDSIIQKSSSLSNSKVSARKTILTMQDTRNSLRPSNRLRPSVMESLKVK
jgi:hypothetical protein